MADHTVFVYGTLKRGHGNYQRLLKDSQFLGEAVSTSNFRMKQVGFPALFCPDYGEDLVPFYGKVKGELFSVSDETLKSLDYLEGNGRMYQREVREFGFLPAEGGEPSVFDQAWVYLAMPAFQKQIYRNEDILPNAQGELIWPPSALSATSKEMD